MIVNMGDDEVNVEDLKDYLTSNKSYYIAAVDDTFPSMWTIGDNKTTNGYHNPALDADDMADIKVHVGYVFNIMQVCGHYKIDYFINHERVLCAFDVSIYRL